MSEFGNIVSVLGQNNYLKLFSSSLPFGGFWLCTAPHPQRQVEIRQNIYRGDDHIGHQAHHQPHRGGDEEHVVGSAYKDGLVACYI